MSKLDNLAQNKPSLVVDDLVKASEERWTNNCYITDDDVHAVLLNRGVYKWLACREQLIALKEHLRRMVRSLCNEQCLARAERRALSELIREVESRPDSKTDARFLRRARRKLTVQINKRSGDLRSMNHTLRALREIFHGKRDQAPTRDREAIRFLERARDGLGLI